MLGQLQAAVAQQLGAVDHRMHQQVLGGPEPADLAPGEDPSLGKDIGIAHDLLGLILHVLIHIIGNKQVHRPLHLCKFPQLIQRLA